MSGFTLSYRDKWDNPVFRNLLEAGIWSWMCDTAAWKDTKVKFNGKFINLKRGQLVVSERFISEGFCIGRQPTRTLLSNLEADHMITRESTQSATIITICNYDKYQSQEYDTNPRTNPPITHQLTNDQPTNHPNKKEYNKERSIIDDYSAQESASKNSVQDIFDWLEKHFNPADVFYIQAPILAWLKWGADFEQDIKPVAEWYAKKYKDKPPRSLSYLDERIAASIKQRTKPAPEATDHEKNTGNYQHGTIQKDAGVLAKNGSFAREAARLKAVAEFKKEWPAETEGLPDLTAPTE